MHSRYALLIFPIIILSASIFTYDIIKSVWNKYAKWCILAIILTWVICTANFQFIPSKNYYFDYTSPQPDFKSAYASIPDWQNIISGFPTLCDWYYSDRWDCINAIRVDLIHDWKTENLLKNTAEKYTKIPYIDNINSLWKWRYYFIIDNLTSRSNNINKTLYWQIRQSWTSVFNNWNNYNNIQVLSLDIK